VSDEDLLQVVLDPCIAQHIVFSSMLALKAVALGAWHHISAYAPIFQLSHHIHKEWWVVGAPESGGAMLHDKLRVVGATERGSTKKIAVVATLESGRTRGIAPV